MKIFFITIAIFLFASTALTQEKCELTLTEAPNLHNLRLGMSASEAGRAVGLSVKVKPDGQRTYFRNYIKSRAKGKLAGVRAIFLRFFDGRLYQIELFYEEGYRWQNLENLVEDYSAANNFSREFWRIEHGYAEADCGGFSLEADFILNPHIQITNDEIAGLVAKEREKK